MYKGTRRWINAEAVTDDDKNAFRAYVDNHLARGGGRTPSPPPMASRVERASERVQSRLSQASPSVGVDAAESASSCFTP
eukprot:5323792-Prymnesium_polylepis.1